MAPPGWHSIQPTGLASAILGVALTFSILSTIVISLRVFVRVRTRLFGDEDWLMCIGYVSGLACPPHPSTPSLTDWLPASCVLLLLYLQGLGQLANG